MQTVSTAFNSAIVAPSRELRAKVVLYNGTTVVRTFLPNDGIADFTIERMSEDGKFFGTAVCQKLQLTLLDKDRLLNITQNNTLKVQLGVALTSTDEYVGYPTFYVDAVERNENTNALTITAYDLMHKLEEYTVSDLTLNPPYTVEEFQDAVADKVNTQVTYINVNPALYTELNFEEGANFNGDETLREALRQSAEALLSITYIDANDKIVIKRLGTSSVLNIGKNAYVTLKQGMEQRLKAICSATELGDNIIAETTGTGVTQYLRENSFLNNNNNVVELLDTLIDEFGGRTMNEYDCSWRGNPALELGDLVTLTTKDDDTFTAYILNDTMTYKGGLSQVSSWAYKDDAGETASNPTTIGEALKQTYAKVDKVNNTVEIVAADADARISELQLTTDNIIATVQQVQNNITESIDGLQENIETLTQKVTQTISASDVEIMIAQERANGAESVKTETGFTFDDSGLSITKSTSEMSTLITEDGMTVSKNDEAMLIANNQGVEAVNLNASTYLIIGGMARFEHYGDDRIGCYWIGG